MRQHTSDASELFQVLNSLNDKRAAAKRANEDRTQAGRDSMFPVQLTSNGRLEKQVDRKKFILLDTSLDAGTGTKVCRHWPRFGEGNH